MSKMTNDGLTRSGTGCFVAVPYGNSRLQIVKVTDDFTQVGMDYGILTDGLVCA